MAPDVLVVGAGPAGSLAALVLARAGVRVTLLDRARFPRHKLCGDTLNPGAMRLLRRLGLAEAADGAQPLEGMRLTGPGRACVEARYPAAVRGAALARREFDARLLAAAVAAGVQFEEGVTALRPLRDAAAGTVTGVAARLPTGVTCDLPARLTIAADGGASVLAAAAGVSARPASPRRWAIGAYFEGVRELTSLGEMHVRRGHYLGVAPLPGGLANAILVLPLAAVRASGERLADLLPATLRRDSLLAPRFADARPTGAPVILGPLALDVRLPGCPGLLLAGDAAGFIDPMTGDGVRLALAGGELTARASLDALEHGWDRSELRLARARQRAFGAKWRFNRVIRRLTGWPLAVSCAAALAPVASPLLGRAVTYAGDARAGGETLG